MDTVNTPLYAQPMSIRYFSSVKVMRGTRELSVGGSIIMIDGIDYLWPTYACVWSGVGSCCVNYHRIKLPKEFVGQPFNTKTDLPITDPAELDRLVAIIQPIVALDEARARARSARATEIAKGDALLGEVILWNMDYEDGDAIDPWMVEGIAFYRVGRNSSHAFYVGVKDGQRYTIGHDYEDEGPPKVRAVESWDGGYYGHF